MSNNFEISGSLCLLDLKSESNSKASSRLVSKGIVLLIFGNNFILLIIGAFLFGSSYAIGAVSLPLLTKYFFQVDHYAKVFPSISFASNLGAAISLSMVGYIYDFFGSYLYGFVIAFIMVFIGVLLLVITQVKK